MADLGLTLSLVHQLADVADRIAAERFGADDLVLDVKPNGSPICDADRSIEAAVADLLRRHSPDLPIFGGEFGPTYQDEPAYWAIDPIDGTAAFISGKPGWGFTGCLVQNAEPAVGVASSVGLGKRWWASRGQGGFVRDLPAGEVLPLRVSTVEDLQDATVGWWDGYRTEALGRTSRLDAIVDSLKTNAASVVATGAAALAVASGDLDAAVMRSPDSGPWHSALFVLLVREGGGVTTDLAGDGHTVLFSNPQLHDQLVALVADSSS